MAYTDLFNTLELLHDICEVIGWALSNYVFSNFRKYVHPWIIRYTVGPCITLYTCWCKKYLYYANEIGTTLVKDYQLGNYAVDRWLLYFHIL